MLIRKNTLNIVTKQYSNEKVTPRSEKYCEDQEQIKNLAVIGNIQLKHKLDAVKQIKVGKFRTAL